MWNHVDIDPCFIEEEKRKETQIDNRFQIELPLPQYYPAEENPQQEQEEKRGVDIIELF